VKDEKDEKDEIMEKPKMCKECLIRVAKTNGLYIWAIFFSPSVQGDKATFRLGSATGNVILHWEADNVYDEAEAYFPPGIPFKLYFDSDDPGDTAIITIILR